MSYKNFLLTIVAFLFFPAVFFATNRVVTNFGSNWKFIKSSTLSYNASIDDSNWETVTIPHTWNAYDGEDGGGNYLRTIGWYRKTIGWSNSYAGKRVYVEALAASLKAECYVNGNLVYTHKGGYNAFRFEITDYLSQGNETTIDIRVNNQKIDDIAPLSGDFTVFGGLYRKIFLVVADPVHVDLEDCGSNGLYLTTSNVSNSSATLEVRAKIVNQSSETKTVNLKAVLKNPDTFEGIPQIKNPRFDVNTMHPGGTVETMEDNSVVIAAGESYEFKKQVTVANPHLWNGLTDPYCYQVDFSISEGNQSVDSVSDYVGFRYFTVDNTGFYLNGKLYPLRGVNRHQDWKDMGYAISENEQNIDFGMIYEIGANAVRMAHYPQDPYFHRLFDKYGIIVWTEIPFVNQPGTDREAFWGTTKLQLKEMIRQRYNHPSIIFWGLQNEVSTSYYNDIMTAKIAEWCAYVKEEDPTGRLTTQAQAGTSRPGWTTDVFGQNRYPGWYQSGTYGNYLDSERTTYTLNGVQMPAGLSEYGAGANINQHEITTLSGTIVPGAPYGHNNYWHPEEYQSLIHELAIKAINARSWVWGTFVWNMFDFGSDSRSEGEQPGINDKGLVTYDRKIKKDAFYIYKANWSNEPTMHIASRRFTEHETETTPVKIYSNCPEVELFVNGVSQGTKQNSSSNSFILEWSSITLSNIGTGDNGKNTIIAKGTYNGEACNDTVIWYRRYSSSTELTSSTLLIDNTTRTISLTTTVDAANIQNIITAANGASFVLVAPDGVTPVTSGNVTSGMKIFVTAEDGETKVVYEFVVLHIAYQKTATADAQENTTNTPAKAVDGDLTTRWAAPDNAMSSSPHWLQVDLGHNYVLNRVAMQWFNSTSNSRAYKYTVQAKKDGETTYSTFIDRSFNTQTDLVSDAANDSMGRYVRVYVTGSTNSSAYAYPSIYELQINGWYITSEVYDIDFSKKIITIPDTSENLDIEDFLNNITFSGNESHSVESAAYYIVDGSQLIITDSDNKTTAFTLKIEKNTGIATLKNVSNLFTLTSKNNLLHIILKNNNLAQLEVININGKLLMNSEIQKEKTICLSKNMYVIKVYTDNEVEIKKYFML